MTYQLLLVEDEPGIREGLTAFLQLKGYGIITAGSCADGLSRIAENDFDMVITDWHLGDGIGAAIVAASQCPVLVISGAAERVEIEGAVGKVEVMRKPVLPPELVEKIAAMVAEAEILDGLALPIDAQERVALIRAMVRSRHEVGDEAVTVREDGTLVTVEARLSHDDDQLQESVSKIGGDVRCLERGGQAILEIRFFRSGQREETDRLIGPHEPWPEEDGTVAVDFSRADHCAPMRFVELLDRAEAAHQFGRSAYFLNVPAHLRLYLELLGRAHVMPMRETAGPALPAVITELWR
ncbi:MAG: response regulator [Planctomycetota bacterium]|nr:response regulator [Planctomycetota bacterium]